MIGITRADGLWTVAIDRQDKANSLTRAMLEKIAETAEAAGREGASAFVLTGQGRVFSAGADLDEARAGLATDPVWERLSGAVAGLPCLTVAALNGTLAGGACGMALACDIRVAVPGAKIFYPAAKLGFLPQPSDPARLERLVGPARAKMILVAGQTVTTEEALAWGLVDRLVPAEDLPATVAALVAGALAAKPGLVPAIKAMMG